jgi:hypothetical protein
VHRRIRRGFPDFLARCPGAERVPYLREVARLERHVRYVSVATDDLPLPLRISHWYLPRRFRTM